MGTTYDKVHLYQACNLALVQKLFRAQKKEK